MTDLATRLERWAEWARHHPGRYADLDIPVAPAYRLAARGPGVRPGVDDDACAETMDRAVAQLGLVSPLQRRLIVMRYLRGYSPSLVARCQGINYHRCLRLLEIAHAWLDGYFSSCYDGKEKVG